MTDELFKPRVIITEPKAPDIRTPRRSMAVEMVNTERPSIHEAHMWMAVIASLRATCKRRRVGCVITDANNFILSVGYNGQPKGFDHCVSDAPCMGAFAPSGQSLDQCEAIHAEQNAVARLKEPMAAYNCYITASPCVSCAKLLLATSIQVIYYSEIYPSPGMQLWEKAGRKMVHLETDWVVTT